VQVPVEASGPAGQYTLQYTVIADDGDAVKGTLHFTVATAATPTATPVAIAAAPATVTEVVTAPVTVVTVAPSAVPQDDAAGSSGSSGWAWVAVAVVVIGVLGGLALVLRGRRGSDRL
jgi:hypothetical protein